MRPNNIYQVKVEVSGLTKIQVEEGLPDVLDEIGRRPWLFDSQAFWDTSIDKLVVIVGYEFEEIVKDDAFDEISDCVIGTISFDEKIDFDIERI
jgi:hypothetical protein